MSEQLRLKDRYIAVRLGEFVIPEEISGEEIFEAIRCRTPTPEGSVRGEEALTDEQRTALDAALETFDRYKRGGNGVKAGAIMRGVESILAALSTPSPNPQGGETEGECSPDEPACAYNNTTADSWCRVCLLDAFRSCEKAIQTGDIEEVGDLIHDIDASPLASPGTDAPEPDAITERELLWIVGCLGFPIQESDAKSALARLRRVRIGIETIPDTPPASRIPEGDAYDPRIHVWISHDQDDMWVDDLAEIEELEREERDERGSVRAGFYSRTTWESLAHSFAEELREARSLPEGDALEEKFYRVGERVMWGQREVEVAGPPIWVEDGAGHSLAGWAYPVHVPVHDGNHDRPRETRFACVSMLARIRQEGGDTGDDLDEALDAACERLGVEDDTEGEV